MRCSKGARIYRRVGRIRGIGDDPAMTAARWGLAVFALIASAWCWTGLYAAHYQDRARTDIVVLQKLTPAQIRHGWKLVHRASFLNPDPELTLFRADLQ